MFGDLGQGLILAAVGWLLQGRFPAARLLIAAGGSAALFGLLFGSLFGIEGLIPALWLHPLTDPVLVLALPLGLGAMLLTLAQVLRGLEAAWRGELGTWLGGEAGILVLYLAAVVSWWAPAFGWLIPLGAVWFLSGALRRGGPLGGLAGIGLLLEKCLQLLVNSLSFTRVGAFALAHAGLAAAMLSLAEAAGPGLGAALILVVGNLAILLLEGLVVAIQTTRLVLFEFFVRFLEGTGRVFRPLSPPVPLARGEPR
jgi:V/A-type H+-transporting ATPase subunit I